jgi:hypothetical protein
MNTLRPFERSYWAVPGKLLAGCYPGDIHPEAMSGKLEGLVRAQVSLVVNLMEETEVDHSGRPFIDYQAPLLKLAKEAGQQIHFQRFPIRDMSIPTAKQMREILDAMQAEIKAGGVVYVHLLGWQRPNGNGYWLLPSGSRFGKARDGSWNHQVAHGTRLEVFLADAANGRTM